MRGSKKFVTEIIDTKHQNVWRENMYKKSVTIVNESGLHARPAADFVAKAGGFLSTVSICKQGNPIVANAKSIVFVLSLGIRQGDLIEISADGSDEKEAVDALALLVESGFGE